ncbi:NAD-dependent histone deacetylase SIR2 KNAG_0K01800 [Huiozyma naganishii CBS 8797]|uniref:Deacetylase sirtuin-type domain-containing protein n=1 Tax=Huiozyma naganishii (strain ATCC MYA-139 / BCRC 22969 / CBS 8797 / KCTC 17520 / NBRC 10181 / NCYC 3082 / Yp74L-3) TaxID=1071383 RepID=J7RCF8_HUIN7|nr:hypothetical protein KNAG_0K01800 [Kazachstania naganishii CBS 8797]CCK72545.1 hypothetical protein KNAG_0K01800 [Kazachstania naganishii CBS 8797]
MTSMASVPMGQSVGADGLGDQETVVKVLSEPEGVPLAMTAVPDVLKPVNSRGPIAIAMNRQTRRYVLPQITKEDSLNARLYLKNYGANVFLDKYLPEEVNSLYIYFLIRLLGFELKNSSLTRTIQDALEPPPDDRSLLQSDVCYTYRGIDDPLDMRLTVRLIKDLQRAMNKIFATRVKLSNFTTVDDFASRLQSASNVIVLTGAGVSTSLGIPDFRSSEGFYSKIKYLGLQDPQDVFNYEIFRRDPSVFYSIAHMVLPPSGIYSPLHSFIKMLADKNKLLRNYTQNIDNLEAAAGVPAEKLVQCHGSFATASCVTCHWKVPGEKVFGSIRRVELPLCPYCVQDRRRLFRAARTALGLSEEDYLDESNFELDKFLEADNSQAYDDLGIPLDIKSYGVLKPDITFFGEALPSKFHKSLREDIPKCDLLVCIGTSLKVAPVSDIVSMLPIDVPQVLINRDPVKHAEFDLSLLGYCDDIASLVTDSCGWELPHRDWDKLKNQRYSTREWMRGLYNVSRIE